MDDPHDHPPLRWLATEAAVNGTIDHHEEEDHFGVHIEYTDLYQAVCFLSIIYVSGQLACRLLKMPSLVGEIVAGILLGPPLADIVPNAPAWVLLGEIGLLLLVLEAGIDIDVSTLKLIGSRGFAIAIVGSILPIGFGMLIALALLGTDDIKAVIAAGAAFGPTSLGIALNILRSGGVLNTPVGQLIISAAVIDDMIALIVLSQLESLTGDINVAGILVPIVSAFAYLLIGGYLAIFVVPGLVERLVLKRTDSKYHGKLELAIMFGFLLLLMPATYYSKASYLMGAFVAGLAFCTSHELHVIFICQFKRLMQWLMRIFFAASIGFQVPIKDFGDPTVVWQGLVFCLALVGKLLVGFMVPNFTQSRNFTGLHLRDCLVTGFSMAAEGEFAFVIAVFAADNGLIDEDLYASVVLAVLLSTIIPPFALRYTISHYNKQAQEEIQQIAENEMELNHDLNEGRGGKLEGDIHARRAVFLCIQTQVESRWGLLLKLMSTMGGLGLDVIDHRSWHPRGIDTTLVNEVYCKDKIDTSAEGTAQEILEKRIAEIKESLEKAINQPGVAKVKVQRWYPGVVEEITESVHGDRPSSGVKKSTINIEERLLREATANLDKHQTMQTQATKDKTVEEILAGMRGDSLPVPAAEEEPKTAEPGAKPRPRRRVRQKMRSTPVVGGGLFGETAAQDSKATESSGLSQWKPDLGNFRGATGHKAEIVVQGESFFVRLSEETLTKLRRGFSGDFMSSSDLSIRPDTTTVVNQLHGYVRSTQHLARITEDHESESDTASLQHGGQQDANGDPNV